MLAVVSGGCSIIDTIAIDIWARRAGLPRQRYASGGGGMQKKSAIEQHRRCNSGTDDNSCRTMEFMVNAKELSTDRAWTGVEN
jgi:hypothetical protein